MSKDFNYEGTSYYNEEDDFLKEVPEEFERMIPRYDQAINEPQYKYSENLTIEEFSTYICSTYGEHYAGKANQIQAFDIWEACDGDPSASHRNTAIKYLFRYGKKEGYNRKDLLKAMHYLIMLMHYHTKFHQHGKCEKK